MKLLMIIATAVLHLAALAPPLVLAQGPLPGELRVTLPFDLVDFLDNAKFKIRVPANWNGTLLVYLQGFKLPSRPAEPILVPAVVAGSQPPLEETLLSRGYALAASEFGDLDMQPKESVQDSLSLTSFFRGRVGDPTRVIVWGTSMGGEYRAENDRGLPEEL